MIIPAGSTAITLDDRGKIVLAVTKDDKIILLVEDELGIEAVQHKLGEGASGFAELMANIRNLERISGD